MIEYPSLHQCSFSITNKPSISPTPQSHLPHTPTCLCGRVFPFDLSLQLGVVVCNRGIEWPLCSVSSLLSARITLPSPDLQSHFTWCSLHYLNCLFPQHVRLASKPWSQPTDTYFYYSWILVSYSVILYSTDECNLSMSVSL